MIRELQESDIKDILFRAPEFWVEIEGKNLLGELCLAGFSNFLRNGFRKKEIIGWCAEKDGRIISAILFRHEFAFFTGKTILSEIFWWSDPSFRNSSVSYRLIKAAEAFAVKEKIDSIMMACMEYPRPERLSSFYQKIGYQRVQLNFCKNL